MQRDGDHLPVRDPLPRPSGWFEVFCCGTMVLAILAVVVVVAVIR